MCEKTPMLLVVLVFPNIQVGRRLMHVLVYDGKAIAAAERMERLSEAMAGYNETQQAQMRIDAVEVLD
jgi:hypothetical protein